MGTPDLTDIIKDTIVLIPAYNEHQHIGPLIGKIFSMYRGLRILLVDDGSNPPLKPFPGHGDGKLMVIRNPFCRGKGYSIRRGLEYIVQTQKDCSYIITMDGDGQHAPEDLHLFLSAIPFYPLLIGRRQFSPLRMPLSRIFSNFFSSLLLSLRTGTLIRDSQCGFRAFHTVHIPLFLQCRENGFQFETEMVLLSTSAHLKPAFIPVQTIYNSSKSHIRKIRDILSFIKIILFR